MNGAKIAIASNAQNKTKPIIAVGVRRIRRQKSRNWERGANETIDEELFIG